MSGEDNKAQVIFAECKSRLKSGANAEEIVSFLKDKGYTQGPSVFFLQRLGFSATDAKRTVVESAAWRNKRRATEELHKEIDENF